ncbi:unnamed protein product [Chrysoparadoxa australica]
MRLLPLAILEATLLAIIPYFMVGLRPGAPHWFYFWGILVGLEFIGQAWGRFISAACPTQVFANTVTTAFIFTCGLISGYMPSYQGIGWWWRWLSWVTPVSYGFEGVMINEFDGRDLSLFVLVNEEGMTEVGNLSGTALLNGGWDLPRLGYSGPSLHSARSIKSFDLGMLFLFSVALDCLAISTLKWSVGAYGETVRRTQESVPAGVSSVPAAEGQAAGAGGGRAATVASLVVKNLTYDVEIKVDEPAPGKPAASSTAAVADDVTLKDAEAVSGAKGVAAPTMTVGHHKEGAVPKTAVKSDISGGGALNNSTYGQNQDLSVTRSIQGKLVGSKAAEATTQPQVKKLRLLNSVEASFETGRMTALMGESGAGKTTLLDVIAGYKTGGEIGGGIFINGQPREGNTWKLLSGYCEQCDIHNPYLTVHESLSFAAACRLPASLPQSEKASAVDQMVDMMGLADFANMKVGQETEGEGLPKHARKRMTIAVELVGRPQILFLDEPTSGLDAMSSSIVLSSVRNSTDQLGLIVVATIHQPSRALFELFDDLLLLKKGGKTAYHGPIGESSSTLIGYLTELHPSLTVNLETDNPADFALGVAEGSWGGRDLNVDTLTAFAKSSERRKLTSKIDMAIGSPQPIHVPPPRPGLLGQFGLLVNRQLLAQRRNTSYCGMRVLWTLFGAIMVGTTFLQLEDDLQGCVLRIAAIFFAVYVAVVPMQAAVVPLMEDRAVFYRETASGTYSKLAYSLASLVAELPLHFATALLFSVIFYFSVGLRSGAEYFAYFLLVSCFTYWLLPSIGQLFAYACPNTETANGLAGLTIILSTLTMGFLVMYALMPAGWRWAYWANALRYPLQGLVANELAGQSFPLNLTAVLDSMDLAQRNVTILLPQPGADIGDYQGAVAEVIRGWTDNVAQDIVETEKDYLLSCLLANKCMQDQDTFQDCLGLRGPCFLQAGSLAREIPSILDECGGQLTEAERVACVVPYLLPPRTAEGVISLAEKLPVIVETVTGIKSWLVDAGAAAEGALDNFAIPGDLILAVFGWASFGVDVTTEEGELLPVFEVIVDWGPDLRYWYCLFAVAMFIVAIEIFKVLAVQRVCWIVR